MEIASLLRLLAALFLTLAASVASAAGLIGTGERGLLDRADTLQTQTAYNAEKDLRALETEAGLQAAILVVDGLPPEVRDQAGKAVESAFADWHANSRTREHLLVLIDKASRRMTIIASDGLKAKFPPDVLGQLSESVSSDALRVGDLDGAVVGVLRGLRGLAGKAKAAADRGNVQTGTPMKIERVDGLIVVPTLTRPVTDLTATLLPSEAAALEARLLALEAQTKAQLAVLITPTTEPEAIEQYSLRVVEAWKLGQEKIDNGVLLLIAKDDRKMRIEVGYGLEGALNDATAKGIISEVIGPRFKENDFFGGIQAGIERIAEVIRTEPVPATPPSPQDEFDMADTLALWIATLAGLLLSFFLRGRMSLTRSAFFSALAGASLGLVLGLFMGGPLLALMSAIPIFLGAHLSLPDPRTTRKGIPFPSTATPFPDLDPPSSWSGGSSDSGHSYSSGSSYSGGGGKFGGGGASGGW